MRRFTRLGLVGCALAATWAALRHSVLAAAGFAGATSQSHRPRPTLRTAVRRLAKEKEEISYKINDKITASEVRLIAEATTDIHNPLEEVNEVMSLSVALNRAKSRGLDLICVKEGTDPPIVKIAKYSKLRFEESKKSKELARKGKAPKVKEVKMSYTIGDHDLDVYIRKMEKWFANKKQTVRVTVQLKGRTRMFAKNAVALLERVRREVAGYGKVTGDPNNPIQKDGRGDLYILFSSGPDRTILKELKDEALKGGVTLDAEEVDDEEDEEDDDEDDEGSSGAGPPVSQEVLDLETEIKEMREELRDCGIAPKDIDRQPEMVDLMKELREVKAKLAMSAGAVGSRSGSSPVTSALFVAGAGGLVAATLRPRRRC